MAARTSQLINYANIAGEIGIKVYFMDTGLVCHLTKWNTPETLENGAFSGAILETYVVSEILKSYWHNGKTPAIYFYRDKDKREVDIILEESGKLYPLEVKQKTNPNVDDIRHFAVLSQYKKEVAAGGVLCLAPTHLPLGEKDYVIPISYI